MLHSPGKAKVWFSLQSANLHTHLPHSISEAEHFAFTRSWGSASGKNAGRLADKTSPLPRLDERRATIKWAVVAWNILQDLLLEEGCRNGFLGGNLASLCKQRFLVQSAASFFPLPLFPNPLSSYIHCALKIGQICLLWRSPDHRVVYCIVHPSWFYIKMEADLHQS